ncbi:MAG: hypothetical protein B6I26_07090 [Desulfobacteraceae bacterium 4572_130]|nr:MAG: hypothetical protein B6I26_07090 [Desulfobacteraceae bacterium 4572_130]
MKQKKFSHVSNYTDYMEIIFKLVISRNEKQKILDMPAGNGKLAEKLREYHHKVICADINNEKKDYVFVDMEKLLPFNDNEFDTVICMEGIEHILNPVQLISELSRICKKKGRIIISLPNIQNLYSRYQFLCTGTFYQFSPVAYTKTHKHKNIDKGHITSLSYIQLHYLFKYFGAHLISIKGDKYKRKILIPLLIPFIAMGYLWTKFSKGKKQTKNSTELNQIQSNLFAPPVLLSRSLILVFEKTY